MKLIYVVIDGMGDLPTEKLNWKTPLEYAKTTQMDELARNGRLGIMYTVRKGIAPESDVGVVSILGYDPFSCRVSRGVFEAVGAGIAMRDGDLALRCNFATADLQGNIVDRRAGRNLSTKEASELAGSISKEVILTTHPADFEFRNTIGHRCVLVIKTKSVRLSDNISNTDPAYTRVGGLGVVRSGAELRLEKAVPLDDNENSRISAELVNEFVEKSHTLLDQHPVNKKRLQLGFRSANLVLTRDAGNSLPKLENIRGRFGLSFACHADMPVEIGISRLVGMNVIDLPPPSGDLRRDCDLRFRKLLENLGAYDCHYVHIKGPDEPGHDGDAETKARLISVIDEAFFGQLLPRLDLADTVVCVTADHSTPCSLKEHSDDPVPVLISGGKVGCDGSQAFSESECRRGSLGVLERGHALIPMLVNYVKA